MTEQRTTISKTWAHMNWVLDNRRVLVNPNQKLLILSDIHTGYYSSLRAQGSYLPAYDSVLLREAINSLLTDYSGYHWVIAGDIKHNKNKNLSKDEKTELKTILDLIAENSKLTVIKGNHDKGLDNLFSELEINCDLVEFYPFNGIIITHNQDFLDQKLDQPYIIGHFHPIISIEHLKGSFIPIFAINEELIILPAFNYVAGGFNIKKLYYKNKNNRNFTVYALGKQIYDLGSLEKLM